MYSKIYDSRCPRRVCLTWSPTQPACLGNVYMLDASKCSPSFGLVTLYQSNYPMQFLASSVRMFILMG